MTKKKVKYVGRYAAVRVPGLGDAAVAHGEEIEVEDEELLELLLEQPANWKLASGAPQKKKDAATEEDSE